MLGLCLILNSKSSGGFLAQYSRLKNTHTKIPLFSLTVMKLMLGLDESALTYHHACGFTGHLTTYGMLSSHRRDIIELKIRSSFRRG